MEPLPETNDTLVTLKYIIEPSPMQYLKSFFGLFSPWPNIKEYEVKFVGSDNKWFDVSSFIECAEPMCLLLNGFVQCSKSGKISNLIGVL